MLVASERKEPLEVGHENWYFRTLARRVYCKYHELWCRLGDRDLWSMEQAYLSVFMLMTPTAERVSVLCVHSDPNDTSDGRVKDYKRGPHLHVQNASYPLPKCHFPLNYGHLDAVLRSAESLTGAMHAAVQIVADELLSRYTEAA